MAQQVDVRGINIVSLVLSVVGMEDTGMVAFITRTISRAGATIRACALRLPGGPGVPMQHEPQDGQQVDKARARALSSLGHGRSTGTGHPVANLTGRGGSGMGTLSGPDRVCHTPPRLPGSTVTHAHHLDKATVECIVPYQTLCVWILLCLPEEPNRSARSGPRSARHGSTDGNGGSPAR
jgi:hypothetical protein